MYHTQKTVEELRYAINYTLEEELLDTINYTLENGKLKNTPKIPYCCGESVVDV